MSKKDIHQLIEKQNPEGKAALRKKVKDRLSLPVELEQVQKKSVLSFFKKRYHIFASVATAIVVVCLAIVIPVVLNRDTGPTERYCYAADCVENQIDNTLKEYSEQNNLSLLYIDWYDIADEVDTLLYVNINDESDVIYMQETLVNGEIGSIVTLYITDLHTNVDRFENMILMCEYTDTVNNINVHWKFQNDEGIAHFEYSGNKYFINLKYPMAEDSVLELVESMIPKK